ncbi:hypothetical protein ACXR6G_19400 [Ancylomarina sp. YFZ004]
MMSKNFLIVVLFLLTVVSSQVKAQHSYKPYEEFDSENKEKASVVHSVNLSAGLYSPKMDYWNDTYLPAAGSREELGSNIVIGGNISFIVASEFRARAGVSYWSDKAEEQGLGLNELKVSFTRFSLGAFYAPELVAFGEGFQLYGGLEAFYYDINNTLDMQSENDVMTSEDLNGHDVSFAPVIGIDKVFGEHILIGAEFSYMIGEYTQAEIVDSQTQKVSIAGPQLSLSVGYKF